MNLLKAGLLGLVLLGAGGSAALQAQSKGDIDAKPGEVKVDIVDVQESYFYDRLAPYGEWEENADHGWVWSPSGVDADWRPYSDGQWIYTADRGWYWHSDVAWSWAAHHYGRWVSLEQRWLWVPGYEWASAWVAWRHGGGYVGWAPLPPTAKWETGVGVPADSFNYTTDIPDKSWVFVEEGSFNDTSIHSVKTKAGVNAVHIKNTAALGTATVKDGVIVNKAITLEAAEKFTKAKITQYRLRSTTTLGGASLPNDEGEVRLFRPRVAKGTTKPYRGIDQIRNEQFIRLTMTERHETEAAELPERQKRAGKDKATCQTEYDAMVTRHKREVADHNTHYGKTEKAPSRR